MNIRSKQDAAAILALEAGNVVSLVVVIVLAALLLAPTRGSRETRARTLRREGSCASP